MVVMGMKLCINIIFCMRATQATKTPPMICRTSPMRWSLQVPTRCRDVAVYTHTRTTHMVLPVSPSAAFHFKHALCLCMYMFSKSQPFFFFHVLCVYL